MSCKLGPLLNVVIDHWTLGVSLRFFVHTLVVFQMASVVGLSSDMLHAAL